ncbi:MAG TPA: glycosyltransferase family 9 protein [Isosphaeraceae bacterium]|nr:glycosyltransferase family 9 protein [Isosphaeraceae bacterium]
MRALDAVGTLAMALWRLVRPIRPAGPPRRILIVQLDHLGDAVLSSPLFPRLKAAYPGTTIDVLASPSNRALFEAVPDVDAVRVASRSWFDRRPSRRSWLGAVWELGRTLRDGRYDLGIDVRGDVLTVLVLALARIPRRVGWAMGGGGFLLTDRVRWEPGRHEVLSRLAILETLGIEADGPARVTAPVADRDRARVGSLLRESWPMSRPTPALVPASRALPSRRRSIAATTPDRDESEGLHAGRFGAAPLLVAHLGAGTSAKRWPPGHWRSLIDRFLDDGWRVVVVGGVEDADAAAALATHRNLRDWTGRLAVTETAALIERADLFIGADSAPAHLAACAGVAAVVLFSGTNRPRQWRPWSRRALVVRHRVACAPCHQKSCPLADHPCLTGLRPERVYRASRRWWARLHRSESPHAPL